MTYTINNLNDALKRKFGGRFVVRKAGGMLTNNKYVLILEQEPRADQVVYECPKPSDLKNLRWALRSFRSCLRDTHIEVSNDGSWVFWATSAAQLKLATNALIADLEALNASPAQQLLTSRNEVVYEIAKEKARFGKRVLNAKDEMDEFNLLSGVSLRLIDQLSELHPDDDDYVEARDETIRAIAECSKSLMGLNGNAHRVATAISAFLLVLAVAGVGLGIVALGVGLSFSVPLVLFGVGVTVFCGAAPHFLDGSSEFEKSIAATCSTISRLMNRHCSLFKKHHPPVSDTSFSYSSSESFSLET